MRKSLFLVLAAALASTCAFAVDGVVLINQSTVTAAGGFPYTITQPGSYKLSGNLTPPLNVTAIQISTGNVSLDLNGFTISCSFTPPSAVACVTAKTPFSRLHSERSQSGMELSMYPKPEDRYKLTSPLVY